MSAKVQKDKKDLCNGKERNLLQMQLKLKEELNMERELTNILETRCTRYENKFKSCVEEIENLKQHRQSNIMDLKIYENKMRAGKHLLRERRILKKIAREIEKDLEREMLAKDQLRKQWLSSLRDVNEQLKKQIPLEKQNNKLKAEIHCLKAQKEYNGA